MMTKEKAGSLSPKSEPASWMNGVNRVAVSVAHPTRNRKKEPIFDGGKLVGHVTDALIIP